MRFFKTTSLGAAVLVGLLSGCAAVKPDQRFPDVQREVVQRLDVRVVWDRGGPESEAVRAATDALLARPLDADAAVQIALLNSNSLQATFEDLGVAQADLVQAGLLRNPSLGGFLRYLDRSPGGPNWNLGVDVPLLDPFLVPLRKKIAGAALDEAVFRVTNVVLRQAADTRTSLYALQADARIVEARKDVADLAGVAAEFAERQQKAGNVDDLTLARERAALQQANVALIGAENAASVSRERLRRLMGLSGSAASWTIEDQSLPPSESPVGEQDLVELAVSSRLDVAAARKDVERQEYALHLTRKWWLETVQVGVETERASGGGYQTGPHFSFDIPIFDQKQAAIARQEALIRQSRRRLADAEDGVRQDVRTALVRLNAAARVARYYASEVVPLRRQMSGMTEQRYQGMLVGVFELLTAKSEETEAMTMATRAVQDYWTARSDLELAVGRRVLLPSATEKFAPTTRRAEPERQQERAKRRTPAVPDTRPATSAMPPMPGMR